MVIGSDYRGFLDALLPDAFAQAVIDADTVFGTELASLGGWRFTQEDAARITQPVLAVFGAESIHDWSGWTEVQALVQAWMPHAETVVLAKSNHALQEKDPRGVAETITPFLARHPMLARSDRRPAEYPCDRPRSAWPTDESEMNLQSGAALGLQVPGGRGSSKAVRCQLVDASGRFLWPGARLGPPVHQPREGRETVELVEKEPRSRWR